MQPNTNVVAWPTDACMKPRGFADNGLSGKGRVKWNSY